MLDASFRLSTHMSADLTFPFFLSYISHVYISSALQKPHAADTGGGGWLIGQMLGRMKFCIKPCQEQDEYICLKQGEQNLLLLLQMARFHLIENNMN